jgi:ABC-type multidrug transport system fused ATPase/permease subunit
MARADRVAEILASDDALVERVTTWRGGRARGEVTFDGVSFAYEAGRPVLTDVSLAIPAGQRVAVVGRSGAGKSTFAALAARFYDPDAGRVLIDGVDARDHPIRWMRDQVGLVLQDAVLFTGTVAENIAWGIDAAPERIIRVAEAAGADGFIRELPDGYDTELDPGGTGLSGGQRQRIAIARTLLRDPAILVLDEPTTGLDAESEVEVLAGLDVLMRGRTTVIISHSLALARRAERVVVLEMGRVIQDGPPDDLIDEEGAFRQLAVEQGLVAREPRRRGPGTIDPEVPPAGVVRDEREDGMVRAAAEALSRDG